MVFDRIGNCYLYKKLGRRFARAFDFIENTDCGNLAPGRYEIDGNKIFALVQDYYTQPEDTLAWEAHKKYVDLQYVVRGMELMGHNHLDNMEPLTEYSETEDYLLFKGEGSYLKVPEGLFAIFFPHDCHKVRIQGKEKALVKKVVVKILL